MVPMYLGKRISIYMDITDNSFVGTKGGSKLKDESHSEESFVEGKLVFVLWQQKNIKRWKTNEGKRTIAMSQIDFSESMSTFCV